MSDYLEIGIIAEDETPQTAIPALLDALRDLSDGVALQEARA